MPSDGRGFAARRHASERMNGASDRAVGKDGDDYLQRAPARSVCPHSSFFPILSTSSMIDAVSRACRGVAGAVWYAVTAVVYAPVRWALGDDGPVPIDAEWRLLLPPGTVGGPTGEYAGGHDVRLWWDALPETSADHPWTDTSGASTPTDDNYNRHHRSHRGDSTYRPTPSDT